MSESYFLKKVQFKNLQKLVGTNLNRPQIFRRAWAGGQVSSFNAYIDKQESTLKGVLKEGSNMQRPNQYKILIFSIQYDFQILLKYQFSIQSEEYKTKQKKEQRTKNKFRYQYWSGSKLFLPKPKLSPFFRILTENAELVTNFFICLKKDRIRHSVCYDMKEENK